MNMALPKELFLTFSNLIFTKDKLLHKITRNVVLHLFTYECILHKYLQIENNLPRKFIAFVDCNLRFRELLKRSTIKAELLFKKI